MVYHYWTFCIISRHGSLFILTMNVFYYFTLCITRSLLLGMVGIVSLFSSLLYHCWAWLVLPHLIRYWFFLTRHVLYWFTSCFTVSVLLGMACIVSLPTLVHVYCACFVLFLFTFHWLFRSGHGLYCLIAWLTGASLLGKVYNV